MVLQVVIHMMWKEECAADDIAARSAGATAERGWQRRREIGVRMALGAQPRDVIADVMGQGLRLAAVGVVAGIVLALAGARLLNSLLFGTSPTDALTFVGAATLLVAIAALASLVPALRASRVDPLIALREE